MKNDWDVDLEILDLDELLGDDTAREAKPVGSNTHRWGPVESGKPKSAAEPSAHDSLSGDDEREAAADRKRRPSYRERMLSADDSYMDYSEDVPEDSFLEPGDIPSGRGSSRRGGRNSAEEAGRRSGRTGQRHAGRQDRREEEPSRRRIPVHLILPVVIVAVLVIAIIRLVIWNSGVTIDTSTSEGSFNVEVNDSIVVLSSSDLEGAADDGVTTVLCLGNDPFSADLSSSGLAGQIAELGDVEVINAAFPDSQVTCENATYSTDSLEDMDDIFNLFYVAYAISIDDYTSMATVASAHEDETYANAVETLQNTDFSAVDIIAIQYDGIDYINGMSMYNEDVPTELTTYVGSLTNAFELLREAYPHIRLVFLSPWYAEYDGASSRTTDLGNGTIVDYFQWAYDTCGSESVSFIDNYYGSINENNFEEYLSDGVSLNAAGCTKIADHFVYKIIQGNYAEYNVEAMAVADDT